MHDCTTCKQIFSNKQVFKSFWYGYLPIECKTCHATFIHTKRNRFIGGAIVATSIITTSIIKIVLDLGTIPIVKPPIANYFIALPIGIIFSVIISFFVIKFFTFEKQ